MSSLPVQEAAQSKQNLHILILYSALESLLVTILTNPARNRCQQVWIFSF